MKTTRVWLGLLVIAAIAAAFAYLSFARNRDEALASGADLQIVRQDTDDLRQAGAGGGGIATATSATTDLTRRVRMAATSAQIADQLQSVEPGSAAREAGSESAHAPLFMRFGAITLEQTVNFLRAVSTGAEGAAVVTIDLSTPQGADATAAAHGGEAWTAEITLSPRSSLPVNSSVTLR